MDSTIGTILTSTGLLTTVLTAVLTTVISIFLAHRYNKKLHTHETKIQKYINLIEEFAKLEANEADWGRLRQLFNEALFFASDAVVEQILEFNTKFTKARESAAGKNFQLTVQDIQPLVVAIRTDLDLKSRSIKKRGLRFFQKPKQ